MIQQLKNSIKRLALTITFMFLFVMPCNTLLAEYQTAAFEVKGMTCGSCPFILKRTLRGHWWRYTGEGLLWQTTGGCSLWEHRGRYTAIFGSYKKNWFFLKVIEVDYLLIVSWYYKSMTPIIICCIAIALVLLTGYGTLRTSYIDKKRKAHEERQKITTYGN